MLAGTLPGNNRLISKSIMRMFPACFAPTLTACISLMADSLLAGSMIGPLAIAAVAIGNPVVNMFRALVQTISCGAVVKITVHIGRGNRNEIRRSFCLGVLGSFALGGFFLLISLLFANPLALLFGGSKSPEAARLAALYLTGGAISGVVNNIIMAAFGGDATALSIYTAVKGVCGFAQATALGASLSAAPLFGVLYGARDKNGIKRTLREGYKIGLIFTVVWCAVLVGVLPVLMRFYGMSGNGIVRSGVLVCFLFMPVIPALRIMAQLLESTEKATMGILYSVVPDSVIFPLMLLLLLPTLKYTGLWIAYGANGLVFLFLLYLLRSLKQKDRRMSVDRMLCLDESIRSNVPMLDVSIHSNNADAAFISTEVHEFLKKEQVSGRTAYIAALCLEELAADFVAHVEEENPKASAREIMDIKLFSDETSLQIIIRNAAKRYNPLDFDLDDAIFTKVGVKMAQKFARRIDYSYVYKMNIITIDLDK